MTTTESNGEEVEKNDSSAQESEQIETNVENNNEQFGENVYSFIEEKIVPLVRELKNREKDYLSPLIDPKNSNGIMNSARRLAQEVQEENPEMSVVTASLNSITLNIQEFGRISTTGAINEDAKSLRKIGFCLREISDGAQKLSRDPGAHNDKAYTDAVLHLKNATEQGFDFIQRKFSALQRYNG